MISALLGLRWCIDMSIGTLLLIVLIVLLIAGLPTWGIHSYGYGPSGVFGVIAIVLIVLLLAGKL